VAGTKGITFSRFWYRDITEVTRSAAIVGRNVEECVQKRKKRGNTTADARTRARTHTHTQTHTHTDKPSDRGVPRNYEKMWHEDGGEGVKARNILNG
jgi:hypothetical protein